MKTCQQTVSIFHLCSALVFTAELQSTTPLHTPVSTAAAPKKQIVGYYNNSFSAILSGTPKTEKDRTRNPRLFERLHQGEVHYHSESVGQQPLKISHSEAGGLFGSQHDVLRSRLMQRAIWWNWCRSFSKTSNCQEASLGICLNVKETWSIFHLNYIFFFQFVFLIMSFLLFVAGNVTSPRFGDFFSGEVRNNTFPF